MESFFIGVKVRQRCVMLPWLFNIFMDGSMRKIKSKVGNVGARPLGGGGMPVCGSR